MGFLTGSDAKMKKVDTLSSKQKSLLNKVLKRIDPGAFDLSQNETFQRGQSFINELLDPSSEAYKQFEAPYMRQFQEQIVPGLAERFSAYGAQDSSAFNQSMASAATSLQESLANMKTQGMLGATSQAYNFGMAQPSLYSNLFGQSMGTQSYGYQVLPGKEGVLQGLLSGAGQGAGMAAMLALL